MATCGDCEAEIRWYLTEHGHRMPVDLRRIPGGNIEIRDNVAHVVKPDPTTARLTSHHATCPYEKQVEAALKKARRAEKERLAKLQLGLFK